VTGRATKGRRRRAYHLGHLAETVCVWRLRLAGYRVLARRFKAPVGEIDIVARRGDTVAFVEVKARRDDDEAVELTARQKARIERAAEAFVARRPRLAACAMRFDLMVVRPWRTPRHLADAWRP
jgi:putative endonuclease